MQLTAVCVQGIFGAASRGPLASIFSTWADLSAPLGPSLGGKSGRRLFLNSTMTQRRRVKAAAGEHCLSRRSDEV